MFEPQQRLGAQAKVIDGLKQNTLLYLVIKIHFCTIVARSVCESSLKKQTLNRFESNLSTTELNAADFDWLIGVAAARPGPSDQSRHAFVRRSVEALLNKLVLYNPGPR